MFIFLTMLCDERNCVCYSENNKQYLLNTYLTDTILYVISVNPSKNPVK